MNTEPRTGPLLAAGVSLIGAGTTAIAAGWDRWSFCWDQGSFSCDQAQNDPPAPGVLSEWNLDVLLASWGLLGLALLTIGVAVWRSSRGASVMLGLGTVGALSIAVTEVIGSYYGAGSWVLLVLVLNWYAGIGLFGAAALPLIATCDYDPGLGRRVWRWVIAGIVTLVPASAVIEYFLLIGFDGSDDSPTLSGILRGVLYLVAAGCLFVAARLSAAQRRGHEQAPIPATRPVA